MSPHDKLHLFETAEIRVTWSKARCIHSAVCVRGLPGVFQPGERPWIRLEASSADRIAGLVMRCPTGALHVERLDGGLPEAPPDTNTVKVTARGPLQISGDLLLEITGEDAAIRETRATLCRCGASANPPFCDGSHARNGFRDPGEVFEGRIDPPIEPCTDLRFSMVAGGPLRLEGPFVIESADGRVRIEGKRTALCRCGESRNKPFCDGSHATGAKTARPAGSNIPPRR